MIQGENKQDFYDANHPIEIEKRMRQRKKQIIEQRRIHEKTNIPVATPEALVYVGKTGGQMRTENVKREFRKIDEKGDKIYDYLKQKIQKKLQILIPNKNPRKDLEAIGTKAGEAGVSRVKKIASGIKKFLVGEVQTQGQIARKSIKMDQKQQQAYENYKRKVFLARQKRMQQINAQRQQNNAIRRPQMQNNQQAIQNHQLLQMQQQRQQAEAQRQLQRITTPGFYNLKAEHVNPFGLASRYKMNFAQNIFTEKDPENQKVRVNGKYKWRAD
jgi:hypothetical protein